MKKTTLALLLISALCSRSLAQLPASASGNLKLWLMASTGFSNNGSSPATWQDQSGAGNHLTSGSSASTEPTFVSNVLSTGFNGLQFNGSSTYMTRLAANVSGLSGTSASIFVVRIGNTIANTINNPSAPSTSQVPSLLTIAQTNSFNNEFGLLGDWGIHCTSSGVWAEKTHQCYYALPDDKPVITSAVLNTGTTNSDLDYYINGSKSTNNIVYQSSPSSYVSASRSITVGGRYDGSSTASLQSNAYFNGYILEVIAYDRVLTTAEVEAVHKYLKCKYTINYAGCNDPIVCNDDDPDCDDYCYWSVIGNNVNGARNIFGSLNNSDIRIRSNNFDRGIIKGGNVTTGGNFGWNTIFPTARFHVNCADGNTDAGTSDIRFENLESGNGNILAIDQNGYVYNTGIPAEGGGEAGGVHWDVNGNTIAGGANHLGTNSSDDVLLRTAAVDRGILTSGASGDPSDDGRLGWQTLNPTAHLHINCAGGNPDEGNAGSDVRFERLEPGRGNILVIDKEGYVYDSHMRLNEDGGIEPGGKFMKMYNEEKAKVEALQQQVNDLNAKMSELLKQTKADVIIPSGDASKLYQNTPNPFGKETIIEYYVHTMRSNACIMLYDLNGREISKYPIAQKGKGSVTVDAQNLTSGIYMYSLIIDGHEVESKRMALVR